MGEELGKGLMTREVVRIVTGAESPHFATSHVRIVSQFRSSKACSLVLALARTADDP